jgi:hypothetical protein
LFVKKNGGGGSCMGGNAFLTAVGSGFPVSFDRVKQRKG